LILDDGVPTFSVDDASGKPLESSQLEVALSVDFLLLFDGGCPALARCCMVVVEPLNPSD
jgi:hypothetical protein